MEEDIKETEQEEAISSDIHESIQRQAIMKHHGVVW